MSGHWTNTDVETAAILLHIESVDPVGGLTWDELTESEQAYKRDMARAALSAVRPVATGDADHDDWKSRAGRLLVAYGRAQQAIRDGFADKDLTVIWCGMPLHSSDLQAWRYGIPESQLDFKQPVAAESLEDVIESTPWFTGLNLTRNDVDGGYLALVFARPQGGSAMACEKAEGPTIASAIRAAVASAKGEQS